MRDQNHFHYILCPDHSNELRLQLYTPTRRMKRKVVRLKKKWKDWKVWRLGRDTLLPKGWAERRYMSRMMIMIIIILSLNDYRHHIKVLYHWFVQDIVKASRTEKVGHFCKRGEESRQQDKNFETSGSLIFFCFPRYGRLKLEFVLEQISLCWRTIIETRYTKKDLWLFN